MSYVYRPKQDILWEWVELHGSDSADFLHRMTTVDVLGLPAGQGTRCCILDAKGKIISYFYLWKIESNRLAFEFEAGTGGGWKDSLFRIIDHYNFGEDIRIENISGAESPATSSLWLLVEKDMTAIVGPGKTRELQYQDQNIRLCHHGALDYGLSWISLWGNSETLDSYVKDLGQFEEIDSDRIEELRIHNCSPRIDHEITPKFNPLEAGLVGSVTLGKGCYPGQEVIERTVSTGAPAMRLVKIIGEGELPLEGTEIRNLSEEGKKLGLVTSVSSTQGESSFELLAVIRKIHAKKGMEVNFENAGTGKILQVAIYDQYVD